MMTEPTPPHRRSPMEHERDAPDLVDQVAQVLCETDRNYFSRHIPGFPSRKWKSPGGAVYDTSPLCGGTLERQRTKARAVIALVLEEAARAAEATMANSVSCFEHASNSAPRQAVKTAIRALIPKGDA